MISDLDGHLVYSILLQAGKDGVVLDPNLERVEVACELGRNKFMESIERKLVNGKVTLRLKRDFIKQIDAEIKDRRNVIQDSTALILPMPKRIVQP